MKTTLFRLAAAVVGFWGITAGATVYDFTAQDVTGTITGFNSAYFTTNVNGTDPDIPQGSSGSGIFEPFNRIQASPVEQGYNTNASGVFDNKADPFTHDLRLADIPVSTTLLNGNFTGDHYEFFLDTHESDNRISLDSLQVFVTRTPGQSVTTFNNSLLALTNAVLVYDLDAINGSGVITTDNTVDLLASNSGSGRPELGVFISASLFNAAVAALGGVGPVYVVWYTHMGGQGGVYDSGSTFEEWDTKATIPEVSTFLPLLLVLTGVIGVTHLRQRRAAALSRA